MMRSRSKHWIAAAGLVFALVGCNRARAQSAMTSSSVSAPVGAHQSANEAPAAENAGSPHEAAPAAPVAGVPAVTFGTALAPATNGLADATFAAGCFWCVEASFEGVRGVRAVVSGYTGGPEERPTYEQVCDHATGHAEAVRVIYDPREVSYPQLLAVFWRIHDPTTRDQSFFDMGHQYRSGIYVHSAEQRAAAEASKRALESEHKYSRPIVTEIADAAAFWPAEDYHQDYHHTHPTEYWRYRRGSGRDAYIEETWGAGALQTAQRH
jgi:methionine-S-sulfoxide reductase